MSRARPNGRRAGAARARMAAWLGTLALAGCVDLALPPSGADDGRVCPAALREAFFAAGSGGERADLWVVFVDVGHGDATWIRTPGTLGLDAREIVIDAGDDGRPDAPHVPDGPSALFALMDRAGFGPGAPIDLLAVSHPDKDHYGGAPAVLARHPVAVFVEPGRASAQPTWRALEAAVAAHPGLVVRRPAARHGIDPLEPGLRASARWGREVEARLLSADADAEDDNDASLVIALRFRGVGVLLMADAEAPLEDRLLAAGALDALGPVDVLRAGHHGGVGTSTAAFLDRVLPRGRGGPRHAVVSAGRREGLPHPDVLARLAERVGPNLWRTDRGDAGLDRRAAAGDDHLLLRIAGADGALDLCFLDPDPGAGAAGAGG